MTTPTPTPSPEAVEAAARAFAIHDEIDGCFECVDEWEALEDWEREAYPGEYPGNDYEDCANYRARATAALSAAAPLIAAQAKGEAWDAVIARIDLGTPHMVDEKYVAGARWVRNQIEDVLKPTIEGKTE